VTELNEQIVSRLHCVRAAGKTVVAVADTPPDDAVPSVAATLLDPPPDPFIPPVLGAPPCVETRVVEFEGPVPPFPSIAAGDVCVDTDFTVFDVPAVAAVAPATLFPSIPV
jgi:hypothetical protein